MSNHDTCDTTFYKELDRKIPQTFSPFHVPKFQRPCSGTSIHPLKQYLQGHRGVYRIKSVIGYTSVVTRKESTSKIIEVNFFSNLHTSVSLSEIGVTSWTLRMRGQILFSPFIKSPCNHLHVLLIYSPYYF